MQEPTSSLRSAAIALAHEAVQQLTTPDLRAAFLFGSVAWGDADASSDLDIMLLLDCPPPFREVTRIRLPDLVGRELRDGPHFADLDRIALETFMDVTSRGGWEQRVVHSVVLTDTDGFYTDLRARVTAAFMTPAARQTRFAQRQTQVAAHRAAVHEARVTEPALAALHARLAVQQAAAALLETDDGRVSVTHLIENVQTTLVRREQQMLFAPLLSALALDESEDGIDASVETYRCFADALRLWMDDPAVTSRLSAEDHAWATFTYADETYAEIALKVEMFRKAGRLAALQYYLDGMLQVPIRMNAGKVLKLRATGTAGIPSLPEFQRALEAEPELRDAWIVGLRLSPPYDWTDEADALAEQMLAVAKRYATSAAASLSEDRLP